MTLLRAGDRYFSAACLHGSCGHGYPHSLRQYEACQSGFQSGSLAAFFSSGKIVISLGLAAAVFSIAGHYIGSGMVIKNGTKIVRPIVVTVLILLLIKIISGFFV